MCNKIVNDKIFWKIKNKKKTEKELQTFDGLYGKRFFLLENQNTENRRERSCGIKKIK